jgi:hypothetical protein
MTEIHAAIISWDGYGEKAGRIAAQVAPAVSKVTVIYSNAAETPESGPGDWVAVPNSAFFGAKFRRALDAHARGILLLLHADTGYHDWPGLVDRCREVFAAHPGLALWSPDFTHTSFPNDKVRLAEGPGPGLIQVAFPDGIVLALRQDIVRWLQTLDYSDNNLGWGITWAAVARASTRGFLVCRDTRLVVEHEASRGYDASDAKRQRDMFLSQLTREQKDRIAFLQSRVKKTGKPKGA